MPGAETRLAPVRRRSAHCLCLAAALAVTILCSGCRSIGQVAGLAQRQLDIAWNAESIPDVLAEPGRLSARERASLALVEKVKDFARRRLGFKVGDQYTTLFDNSGGPLAYNVSACPPDRFAPTVWRYPVVGSLEYTGYFKRSAAQDAAAHLQQRGLDVAVYEVPAYSTLGWFSDPIFRRQLSAHPAVLAAAVLHELTHVALFVPGDSVFNESLAAFIGSRGSVRFLSEEYGPDDPRIAQYVNARYDARQLSAHVERLYQRLNRLYGSKRSREEKLAERETIFEEARQRFETLRPLFVTEAMRRAPFPFPKPNNAAVLLIRRYQSAGDVFEGVARRLQGNLRAVIEKFREFAGRGDPLEQARQWLDASEPASQTSGTASRTPRH